MICQHCDTCQFPHGDLAKCHIVHDQLLAWFRETVMTLLATCNGNPVAVCVLLAKSAGLSEVETAGIIACSQATVSRHLRAMAARNPSLARELRRRWAYLPGLVSPVHGAVSPRLGSLPVGKHQQPSPGDVIRKK